MQSWKRFLTAGLLAFIVSFNLCSPLIKAGIISPGGVGSLNMYGYATPGGFGLGQILATNPYAFWLATEENYTTADGDDNNVNQLTDLTGNGRHLQAGNSSAYPDYVANCFDTNQDCLDFPDGSGERMANTSDMSGTDDNDARTLIVKCEFEDKGGAHQECGAITTNANINSGAHVLLVDSGATFTLYLRDWYNDNHWEACVVSGITMPYEGVFAIRSDAVTGKMHGFKDGVQICEQDGANALKSTNNRFYLGSPLGSQDLKGHFGGGGIWASAISDDLILKISNYMNGEFSAVILKPNLIVQGDSISADPAAGSYDPAWPAIIQTDNSNIVVINEATGGDTLANMVTNISDVTQHYNPRAASNTVVIFAGTNDIASAGKTGAQVFTSLQSFVSQCISTGFTVYVVTTIDRGGSYDSVIADYNALIISNAASEGYTVIDAAALAAFQDSTDTDYYYDLTHLTVLGHEVMAALIAAALGLN